MNRLRTSLYGLALTASLIAFPVYAQESTVTFGNSTNAPEGSDLNSSANNPSNNEHLTVHGRHAPPPGYTYAPSMNLQHGPDPDHQAGIAKDPVSGANLSKFGTAYQQSGPMSQGKLGDSTGNGWVTPR